MNDLSQLPIDKSKPVLVTGATGYVAGPIVKALLEEGVTVHAAVRDPSKKEKLKELDKIAGNSDGKIVYFKSDLLELGSYAKAMAGCGVVFHTASPFIIDVKDPQAELIDPALKGTRNVLEEVANHPSVTRVVLTSSCAAICGDNIDVAEMPGEILSEEVWNTTSSLEHQPYSYSKTVAEQAAWEIAKAQNHWQLVTINPSLVLGPSVSSNPTSESFSLIKQLGDGTMKMGVPDYSLGCVDVRDLAYAHIAAGYLPKVEGRHILSGHNTNFLELGQALRERFGNKYPFPKKTLPKWLLSIVGPLINKALTRESIAKNVGHPWQADNSKSKRELGVNYRPFEESVCDMFEQLHS